MFDYNLDLPDNLNKYRTKAVSAAGDLFYGQDVVNKLQKATSVVEIERIMTEARHNAEHLHVLYE